MCQAHSGSSSDPHFLSGGTQRLCFRTRVRAARCQVQALRELLFVPQRGLSPTGQMGESHRSDFSNAQSPRMESMRTSTPPQTGPPGGEFLFCMSRVLAPRLAQVQSSSKKSRQTESESRDQRPQAPSKHGQRLPPPHLSSNSVGPGGEELRDTRCVKSCLGEAECCSQACSSSTNHHRIKLMIHHGVLCRNLQKKLLQKV